MRIQPDKQYRVKGIIPDYRYRNGKYVDRRKLGSELTDADMNLIHERRVKIAKRSIVGSVAAALVTWSGVSAIGTPGEKISEQDGAQAVSANAAQIYNGKSLREKFELAYVTPLFGSKAPSTRGGSGLLSWSKPYAADFGQNCLVDTPYSTQPSEITGRSRGTIMPPAAFHMDARTGDAFVTPYGGNSDGSLRFSVKNGELIPTVETIATLAANNCVIVDGIPATTPRDSYNSARTDVLDISAVIGSIHPGDYRG
jgi:hypothetical protein